MENEKKRLATYTMNVPMQITFCADNDIDGEEFLKVAEKEVYQRLANGYFDVKTNETKIVRKITHMTREEIAAEKVLDKYLADLGIRGLRS